MLAASPAIGPSPDTIVGATQSRPVAAPGRRTLWQIFPPATVVLHNDEVNEMDHVVRALRASVGELSAEDAGAIMLAAHLHGQADVVTCPLERAELYQQRLESYRLTATIRRE